MSDDTRIDKLEDSGRYLFIYSDKHNVYFFFQTKAKKLYKITTDKYLDIEYVDEIETPGDFFDYSDIKFFKPYTLNNGSYDYIGVVTINDRFLKFNIENEHLTYGEELEFSAIRQFNTLDCLRDIEIKSHIQKKNKLFLVGVDHNIDDSSNSIYGVVDLESDKFEQIYYLYSDKKEIVLETINIDTDDLKVYVGGYLKSFSDEEEVPFMETFLLRK